MRCEAMARSEDSDRDGEIWGTWEELLLACAVNRHGTRCWDSVAMEVRSRRPLRHLLTPDSCKRRYLDLQRRFAAGPHDGIDGGDSAAEIPWLEELRKLRVAELRREVQRYDVSIGSLQLKVQKLKEERDRAESGEKRPDLTAGNDGGSPGSTLPGGRISGGDSDSGRSSKESNATEPTADDEAKAPLEAIRDPDPGPADRKRADPVTAGDDKSAGEASYNGSSETIAKNNRGPSPAAAEPNPVGESGESVAESKDVEPEGAKESSDVQSSASLSRRRRGRRRNKTMSASSSGGDEPEAEAVSPVRKPVAVESQPLMAFLEIIRSHECGSAFERRLDSQEGARYRSLIRRHVDLEMVRNKIGSGGYTSAEFFRDLLLLCNNALVFHPKGSPESIAAVQLRDLVGKEIARTLRKPPRPPPPPASTAKELTPPPAPSAAPNPKPEPKPEPKPTTIEKPAGTLPTIVACRKRSSISAKATAKAEKEEKPNIKEMSPAPAPAAMEEQDPPVEKKRTKERTAVSATRGLRSNKTRGGGGGGNRGGAGVVKSPSSSLAPNRNRVAAASTPEAEEKAERKGGDGGGSSTAKKRSAANFLNRMKRSSPSSVNGTLLETLKGSGSGGGKATTEQQRKGPKGGEGRKEQAKKRAPAESAPVKRSVGRPPKKLAGGKRAREEADLTPARKRGRK